MDTIGSLTYKLVRSAKRKTLALQVRQGSVVVRAPAYLCEKYIDRFVLSKKAWLVSKIQEQLTHEPERIRFEQANIVPVLGQDKVLSIVHSSTEGGCIDGDTFIVSFCKPKKFQLETKIQQQAVQAVYEQWLQKQAIEYFPPVVAEQALIMSLNYKSITLKRYKARWGSCNNRAELSFNYLLMMCPEWVIKYVIIHELSHLTYLNHSKNFWQLVQHYCPDYKKAQNWLKHHSYYIRS